MRWLVVSSNDERYDFNLNISIFNGTKEEFEQQIDNFFLADTKDCKEINGTYHYHKSITKVCDWDDDYNIIHFETVILIPLEKLMNDDFYLYNSLVARNLKFGFLDTKNE